MAAALPSLDGSEVVKPFQRLGWEIARQRGSHIIMVRDGHRATLFVPDHSPVAKATLRSLIRSAGISVDEFVAAIP